jgi:superkiller protein 3
LELFRSKHYERADDKAVLLLNRNPSSPEVLNLRGLIAVRKMEHNRAQLFFESALEADPSFGDARINLASLYMNMHRHSEAEKQYRLARQVDPNNPGIPYNLGLLYFETGQLDSSRNEFSRAAGLASGEMKSKALCQLGMVQLSLKDTVPARSSLDEAILLSPRNELARLQLALTFSDDIRRENELLKIYRLNPTSYQANYYLGNLYKSRGLNSKAEYHYRKALEKQPYNEHLMKELGDLLILQERMEEAELVLSGFSAGDTLPQAYFYQAKIAAGKGQTDEAIALYRQAIERANQEYPEAFLNMAILYKQKDDHLNSILNYRYAIAGRPHYSLAHYNLALLYTELDSIPQAINCYRQSIRIDPEAIKSWYNLGRLYDDLNNNDSAIFAYEYALQIDPAYTRAMLTLANAYLRTEEYQLAIGHYQRLLSYYPRYSKAWFNLGLAYSRQDNAANAMEAYENLIEVDPENVRARINLAILYGRNDKVSLAISVLEDAMDLEMDNPHIRFNLALQYKRLDNTEQAIYQFLKVIELDPGYRRAYDQLLMLFTDAGDDVNYEIIAFRKNKQFNEEVDFYETGKRLHEMNQYALALEAYNLSRSAGDDSKWLIYWTGKAYLDLEEVEEAISWFNSVLEKDSEHKFALYRLGQAYEMLGETEQAASYYSELLQLDPDFKIVHKSTLASLLENQVD